jgi:hypothetical protein
MPNPLATTLAGLDRSSTGFSLSASGRALVVAVALAAGVRARSP